MFSKLLNEEREYLVYTPRGYQQSKESFPVMYLFDGRGHFLHVAGIVEFLSRQGRIPAMIIVGVVNTDRNRDFTPTNEQRIAASGGADRFLSFLHTELMPLVDSQYRTMSYRIMVGHSFGGLLAIHTLLQKPDMFGAYIAISPSLQWDDQLIQRSAEAAWTPGRRVDKFLYFTLGTEGPGITKGNEDFAAFLRQRAPEGLTWSYELMENEDHGSTPHRTVYRGLEKLFDGWKMPRTVTQLAEIQAHYRQLSERFGMDVQAPEGALNLFGYRLLGQGKHAEAIEVFRFNVTRHPDSANVYDSLGEALEKTGDLEGALANYELAVKQAAASRHAFLELFMTNRDRVQKQLAGQP